MSDDDDDELLLATTFTFKKRQSSNFKIIEEERVLQLDLKEFLGETAEKDAILASDDFWEKFNLPTQEEIALKQEEQELQENISDEEDEEETIDYFCTNPVKMDFIDETEIYSHLNFNFDPIIFQSSIISDLSLNIPIDTLLPLFGKTEQESVLSALYKIAISSLSSDEFSSIDLPSLLNSFGIDPSISVNKIQNQKCIDVVVPKGFGYFLKVIVEDLKICKEKFTEDQVKDIFTCVIPLIFDPNLNKYHHTLHLIIVACIEWIPLYNCELILIWISSLEEFLLSPIKRLIIFLRIISCSINGKLFWISIIDHFLNKLFSKEDNSAMIINSDRSFISQSVKYIEEDDNDTSSINRCLGQLSKILNLIWLRLLSTCIDELDQVKLFKEALSRLKESIPAQPYINNIICLDLSAKMTTFLETILRSKGHKTCIDSYFKRK